MHRQLLAKLVTAKISATLQQRQETMDFVANDPGKEAVAVRTQEGAETPGREPQEHGICTMGGLEFANCCTCVGPAHAMGGSTEI